MSQALTRVFSCPIRKEDVCLESFYTDPSKNQMHIELKRKSLSIILEGERSSIVELVNKWVTDKMAGDFFLLGGGDGLSSRPNGAIVVYAYKKDISIKFIAWREKATTLYGQLLGSTDPEYKADVAGMDFMDIKQLLDM